jgi:hypothetical protein
MTRNRYIHPRSAAFALLPRNGRGYCFCVTAIYSVALLLWGLARSADALTDLSGSQCKLLLSEVQHTFVRDGDGYPAINSCASRIVRLMWDQQIQRVYSDNGAKLDSFDSLRSLPDAQFAKLVVNAAAGSLMDSSQQGSDDSLVRIRVDTHGHFQRYILHDSNRIIALQTMLVLSIVTLAVTWWRIDMKQRLAKTTKII